jgi:hypothetical protein
MRQYNNQRFITQATINDNTVILTQDNSTGKYYSYWGLGEPKSKVELTKPSGKPMSEASAIEKFLEMVEAAQYVKFDKL